MGVAGVLVEVGAAFRAEAEAVREAEDLRGQCERVGVVRPRMQVELVNDGPVFVRGDVGPFRPYLPSGAYL